MPNTEKVTFKTLLEQAEQQLESSGVYFGHGFDNPWDEALALLLHVTGLSWDADETTLERLIPESEQLQFDKLLSQRIEERKPVGYLIKEAWFMGMPFYITEDVLIPRSPIAELIDMQFSFCLSDAPEAILDLCCGSGCIGIAAATVFEHAQVDLLDISDKAIDVANINIEKHGLQTRVHAYCSDLFQAIPPKKYQLILSNPPYVDEMDMSALPEEYRNEPALALEAGEDGLNLVTRILKEVRPYLDVNGWLIVEVGNSQEAMMQAYPDLALTWLEFENGGHGVFALSYEDLMCYNF